MAGASECNVLQIMLMLSTAQSAVLGRQLMNHGMMGSRSMLPKPGGGSDEN